MFAQEQFGQGQDQAEGQEKVYVANIEIINDTEDQRLQRSVGMLLNFLDHKMADFVFGDLKKVGFSGSGFGTNYVSPRTNIFDTVYRTNELKTMEQSGSFYLGDGYRKVSPQELAAEILFQCIRARLYEDNLASFAEAEDVAWNMYFDYFGLEDERKEPLWDEYRTFERVGEMLTKGYFANTAVAGMPDIREEFPEYLGVSCIYDPKGSVRDAFRILERLGFEQEDFASIDRIGYGDKNQEGLEYGGRCHNYLFLDSEDKSLEYGEDRYLNYIFLDSEDEKNERPEIVAAKIVFATIYQKELESDDPHAYVHALNESMPYLEELGVGTRELDIVDVEEYSPNRQEIDGDEDLFFTMFYSGVPVQWDQGGKIFQAFGLIKDNAEYADWKIIEDHLKGIDVSLRHIDVNSGGVYLMNEGTYVREKVTKIAMNIAHEAWHSYVDDLGMDAHTKYENGEGELVDLLAQEELDANEFMIRIGRAIGADERLIGEIEKQDGTHNDANDDGVYDEKDLELRQEMYDPFSDAYDKRRREAAENWYEGFDGLERGTEEYRQLEKTADLVGIRRSPKSFSSRLRPPDKITSKKSSFDTPSCTAEATFSTVEGETYQIALMPEEQVENQDQLVGLPCIRMENGMITCGLGSDEQIGTYVQGGKYALRLIDVDILKKTYDVEVIDIRSDKTVAEKKSVSIPQGSIRTMSEQIDSTPFAFFKLREY